MKIGKDKWIHLFMGFLISWFGVAFISLFTYTNFWIITGGVGLALIAGVSKELYDKFSGKGTPEVLDAVFTVLGGILGTLVLILLKYQ